MQVYDELVRESSVVVLSGSMPQGVEVEFYAKLVKRAKRQGTFVILDTSGKALLAAVDAVPNMLKPNAQELEQLVGASIQSDEQLYNQARRFMQSGVDYMMMTRGADGVIAGIDGELYHAEGLRVNVVNTVGCGDSFVAGVAVGIHRGLPAQEMLALAVATSASNAMNQGAGQIRLDDVRMLQSQVVVRRIH
jgi:tagatose 6-phosphate kinase